MKFDIKHGDLFVSYAKQKPKWFYKVYSITATKINYEEYNVKTNRKKLESCKLDTFISCIRDDSITLANYEDMVAFVLFGGPDSDI